MAFSSNRLWVKGFLKYDALSNHLAGQLEQKQVNSRSSLMSSLQPQHTASHSTMRSRKHASLLTHRLRRLSSQFQSPPFLPPLLSQKTWWSEGERGGGEQCPGGGGWERSRRELRLEAPELLPSLVYRHYVGQRWKLRSCAMVRSAGEGETVCRTYIWLWREHWCYFKMQIVGEMRLIMTWSRYFPVCSPYILHSGLFVKTSYTLPSSVSYCLLAKCLINYWTDFYAILRK